MFARSNIPTWLLKRLTHYIAPTICHLCNLPTETGEFPIQLKQAHVVHVLPRLKKPSLDPDTPSSYRPISYLPFISKVIERVVVRRFTNHTSKLSLLPSRQSAYRAYHSTETTVLGLHNDLVRSSDNGQLSLLVLLDLSAAFDTVDHSTLMNVLSNRFCEEGTALKWFESYLTGRSQFFYRVQCSPRIGNGTSLFRLLHRRNH